MLVHYSFRDATPDDKPFLLEMLRLALGWREPVPVSPYALDDFGRPGDGGIVAVRYDQLAGACWWRLLPSASGEPGYGYAGEDIPELTLAVAPLHRGFGLGSELLQRALDRARAAGVAALSLSVEPENPALRLYERLGFERVAEVGGSLTLRRRLSDDE